MRITFLIGNGFDIGLGMHTKFQDMYGQYVSSWTDNQNIMAFKNELRKDAPHYNTWSDFEMGMAEYALKCEDEATVVECLRDFKAYMVEHLMRQEEYMLNRIKINNAHRDECAKVMKEAITSFYQAQSQNTIAAVEQYGRAGREYNFITFNYTRTFDYMLDCYRAQLNPNVGAPIHIHGTLEKDVVLGMAFFFDSVVILINICNTDARVILQELSRMRTVSCLMVIVEFLMKIIIKYT